MSAGGTLESVLSRIDPHVSHDEVTDIVAQFVRIPSISGNEAELARFIDAYCRDHGLDSRIDSHGNVIVRLAGQRPGRTLLLNSHMDTVEWSGDWKHDPFGADIEDGKLYGLGSQDAKAPLAAMMLAMKALKQGEVPFDGTVIYTAVIGEEVQNVDAKGTVMTLRDGLTADMAICGEPSGLRLNLGCEGMLNLIIETFGEPAHSSDPEKGENAISRMAKLIVEIDKLKPATHPGFKSGSINVGLITGGVRASVVPAYARIEVGRFIVPGESMDTFLGEVNEIIARLKRDDPNFRAKLNPTYASLPQTVEPDAEVVRAVRDVTTALTGRAPEEVYTRGHADSDFITNIGGIPCITFGPRGDRSHKDDEYVELDSVTQCVRIYAASAAQLLAPAGA